MKTILKALVGSRAHGLASESSDYDYRGIFVEPTTEILKIGGHPSRSTWIERDESGAAKQDDTAWEIAHFLMLATKCNPSILEVFAAPVIEADEWGVELRTLLPCVWHPKGVRDAFVGYGLNQRKKMLEDKDGRPGKYAYSYLRVLASAESLLTSGILLVDMSHHPLYETLVRFKRWKDVSKGETIDVCGMWQSMVERAAEKCQHAPDLERVNDYLLRLRAQFWDAPAPPTVGRPQ